MMALLILSRWYYCYYIDSLVYIYIFPSLVDNCDVDKNKNRTMLDRNKVVKLTQNYKE